MGFFPIGHSLQFIVNLDPRADPFGPLLLVRLDQGGRNRSKDLFKHLFLLFLGCPFLGLVPHDLFACCPVQCMWINILGDFVICFSRSDIRPIASIENLNARVALEYRNVFIPIGFPFFFQKLSSTLQSDRMWIITFLGLQGSIGLSVLHIRSKASDGRLDNLIFIGAQFSGKGKQLQSFFQSDRIEHLPFQKARKTRLLL